MKRKTNISVQDNLGIRITPNLIVGEKFNGYVSGDILDANSVADLVKGSEDLEQYVTHEELHQILISIEDNYYGIRWTDANTTPTRIGNDSMHHNLPL